MFSRSRSVFSLLVGGAALLASATAAFSKTAEEIDASANAAMKRFTAEIKGAKEVIKNAKGILVMANVKKGGFVVGGEFGRGALRVKGKTVSYYKLAAASVGLQAGAESKDVILAFMTDEALKNFQSKKGWEAGVDGNVAIIKLGAGESVTTSKMNKPVIGFVFGVKGVLADVSVKGAKFTKYVPKG
jgi:lipid-binding SYLF domain-containing protein